MSKKCQNSVCLIGSEISDSKSKPLQNYIYNQFDLPLNYSNQEIDCLDNLKLFIKDSFCEKYAAANVTYPYKQNIANTLSDYYGSDSIFSDVASFVAGGSNLIIANGDTFYLYNLDGFGCVRFLQSEGISIANKNIAILGTGVTAKSVAYAFSQECCSHITFISRTNNNAKIAALALSDYCECSGCIYKDAKTEIENAHIIIDATTVYNHTENKDLFSNITPDQIFMDIKYKDENSIAKQAKLAGVKTFDGLGMLVAQAALTIIQICDAFKISSQNTLTFDTIFNAGYLYLKKSKESNCN